MKRIMKYLVSIGALIFIFQSCLKSDYASNTYTLKGRIMSSNTNQPVEGLHLVLWAEPVGMNNSKREIGNIYTDANGNFMMENLKTIDSKNLKFKGGFIPAFTITPVPKHGDTVDRGDIYVNR